MTKQQRGHRGRRILPGWRVTMCLLPGLAAAADDDDDDDDD